VLVGGRALPPAVVNESPGALSAAQLMKRLRRRRARRAAPSSPRDLPVPGRELKLASTSRWSSCRRRTRSSPATVPTGQISATGKHVVVIGGGDTGSDCVGTSQPPWRAVGHPVRIDAAAAGARGEQGADLAVLADQAAHVVVARGRLRARLGGDDEAFNDDGTATSRR
jgi:hypothetical protein